MADRQAGTSRPERAAEAGRKGGRQSHKHDWSGRHRQFAGDAFPAKIGGRYVSGSVRITFRHILIQLRGVVFG